jgi:hypothetical protein
LKANVLRLVALNRVFLSAGLACALLILLYLSVAMPKAAGSYSQQTVGMLEPFWTITHGGSGADEGWGVAVDEVGYVYFAGFDRISNATANVFLRKLTAGGGEVWDVSWGGPFDDEAFVVTVKDGYVYVGGRTVKSFDLASSNMTLLKFHASNGSLVWSRSWDGGHGYDEVDGLVVEGHSLYVSGWTTGASTQNDMALLKYDVNGTLVWSCSWGTSGWDEANGQMAADEDCLYVVGRYNAPNMFVGGDAVLAAFNKTNGSYIWNVTWGGSAIDDAFGMTADSSHIYSVGITNSFGGDLLFLLKYDKAGLLVWNATWGGSGNELTRSVAVNVNTTDIFVAGSTTSYGNGNFDIVLLRYNQNGTVTLSKTWGGTNLDRSHGIAIYDPFIYVAGDTSSFGAGGEDALLLKVDTEGGNTIPEFGSLLLPVLLAIFLACCSINVFVCRNKTS